MNKEVFEYKHVWDYKGWESNWEDMVKDYKDSPSGRFWDVQKDWNQTIATKINLCSAQLYQEVGGNRKHLKVNPNLKSIFETLEYYRLKDDGETMTLGGRYDIEFTDKIPLNTIDVLCEDKMRRIEVINGKEVETL